MCVSPVEVLNASCLAFLDVETECSKEFGGSASNGRPDRRQSGVSLFKSEIELPSHCLKCEISILQLWEEHEVIPSVWISLRLVMLQQIFVKPTALDECYITMVM